jgi:hypothetical protein
MSTSSLLTHRIPLIKFRYGVRPTTPINNNNNNINVITSNNQIIYTNNNEPFMFNLPPLSPEEAQVVMLGLSNTPLPITTVKSYKPRPMDIRINPFDRLPPPSLEETELIESGGASMFDPPPTLLKDNKRTSSKR